LEEYRYRGKALDLHHLMAHCRAFIGQSATMAAEAAVLGVPAIFAMRDSRGYVDALAKRGMILCSDARLPEIRNVLEQVLSRDRDHWLGRQQNILSQCINVADYVVATIERYRPRPT